MNDERTAIINMALEGRLDAAEAGALLDALWRRELGEEAVVEPPCRPPPWQEGVADLNELVPACEWAALLPAASQQIARTLPDADRRLITMALAALDVMDLGKFPSRGDWTGYLLGGFAVSKQGESLHRRATSLWITTWSPEGPEFVLWRRPVALWLFSEPLPVTTGRQPRRGALSGAVPSHDLCGHPGPQGDAGALGIAMPDLEIVVTPLGTFRDCLRVTFWVSPAPGGFVTGLGAPSEEGPLGGMTVWFAPGVGPVRMVGEWFQRSTTEITLSAYSSAGSDGYFPLDAGNWWRFERAGSGSVHRELWRALAAGADGSVWLSAAAYFAPKG
jgi:hypothetical protein